MAMIPHTDDPRIVEIEQLAIDEGLPLALRPETICALEDSGWIVDPFTAMLLPRSPEHTAVWPTAAAVTVLQEM